MCREENLNDLSMNCSPRISCNYERSFSECSGISISLKLYSAAYTDGGGVSHSTPPLTPLRFSRFLFNLKIL